MNLTRFSRLLLSVCVFLSVLCINLHSVHASETDDNYIVYDFNDFEYLDPYAPMLLSDDEVIGSSGINKYSCAYAYADSSGNYGELQWYNLAENPLTFPANQSIYTRILTYFNTDIKYGTYDIVLTLGVPNNYTITSNVTLSMYSRDETKFGDSYTESSKVLTPSKQYDSYTEMAYYTITFKEVDTFGDIAMIRLDFYGECSTQENSVIRPGQFELSKQDETPGLLNSIITAIGNIRTNIMKLPSTIATHLKTFFESIVTAVTDLGDFLIEGIKGLFVPSEEDLTSYFDNWKALLSSRFGALYEVFDIIVGYFEQFTNVSGNSTIVFPSVSIPLAGAVFEFGGWSVNLVPEGFEVVFSALRLMISIICTIAFVNALRRRYDKVVEK